MISIIFLKKYIVHLETLLCIIHQKVNFLIKSCKMFHRVLILQLQIRPEHIPGISWNLTQAMPPLPTVGNHDTSIYGTHYMTQGVIPIQHAVLKALLKYTISSWQRNFDDMFLIRMCRLPYPPQSFDSFQGTDIYGVAITLAFGFFFPSAVLALFIVHEKETNLETYLKVIGVSGLANWIAWFIKTFIFFFVYSLVMTFLLCTRFGGWAIFNQSDASIIFLILILHGSALITFVFFITCFFKKASSAVAATCVFYIITFLPFTHYQGLFFQASLTFKLILCLLPNTLFASSLQIVYRSELFAKGVRWNTLRQSLLHFSMHTALLMYILDIFMYSILTWYFDAIFSGSHHKYPWYFPLTADYWTGTKYIPPQLTGYRLSKPQFEEDPRKVKPMIDIRNLTKKFGKYSKPTVNEVFLKAYKGQITALLGYHCSGKTACASMIYGSMAPTSGSIILKGYNLHKSGALVDIIPLLGICPEYNMSVDELNVEENLYFFCRIKGFGMTGMYAEISHILGVLDLEIEKSMLVSSLAESSKRKLSIAIALIGESEIVILDQPTSEMDTENQRIVWDALKSEKKRRSIFLTTSCIKEAYAVADKIAVIDNGELKCCGSPAFLKKIYGAGYILKMSKEPDCNSIATKNLIASYIRGALFVNETETELSIMLPSDSKHLYHILFKELEEKDLKIKDFMITESTLDDLFIKILGENFDPNLDSKEVHTKKTLKKISCFHHLTRERNDGFTLFCQHAIALLTKRYIFSLRNSFLIVSQLLILPLVFIIDNLMAENIFIDSKELNSSNFDMNVFGKTYVPYGIDPNSNITIDLGDTYAAMLSDSQSLYLVDLDEEDYLSFLMKEGMMNYKEYITKYIIGAAFTDDLNRTLITAFYNSEAYHSAPVSLLYVHNTILSYYTKGKAYYFSVKNNPLPFKDIHHKSLSANVDVNLPSFWSESVVIGMSILMSSFVILLVTEKSSKFKKLQMISGLDSFVYWLSNLIYDYCTYLIPCFFVIIILSGFETQCLSDDAQLGALAILLGLHGLSALLFIYCWTFSFKTAPINYTGIFLYYFFALFFSKMTDKFEEANSHYASETVDVIFSLFFSSYCIARGVHNIFRNCVGKLICDNHLSKQMCFYKNATWFIATGCCADTCGDTCIPWTPSYFSLSTPGIGKHLIALLVQLFFLIIILILLEMGSFHNLSSCIPKRHHYFNYPTFESDDSVQEEAEHIMTSSIPKLVDNNYVLILKNVSKFFPRYLIQKLSLGVKKGECFALTGVDRAGKSTILKMISGCIEHSGGNIYIDGIDVAKYPNKILDKVGFSFRHFPFPNHFTVEDMLTLFAHIRGIPQNKTELFVEALVDILDLNYHALIKNCNDIDKRKLNVAIAVIGNPPLILLDEPTHQMDPVACTLTHEVIWQALAVGCTVFFTTQKMEECTTLCKRVAILVRGKLTFIGQLGDLTEQYKEGYSLILRLSNIKRRGHTRANVYLSGTMDEIREIIEEAVPQAILKVEYASYLSYYVPNRTMKFSELFELLEKLVIQEHISDYSVCETTLEHIFSYHGSFAESLRDKRIADYLKERQQLVLGK